MLKASWGGGGRGMRPHHDNPDAGPRRCPRASREAEAAFGNGEGYLEKMIVRARHVEVQILGDKHGQRLCTCSSATARVQRRNQKVVERAPAPYLSRPSEERLTISAPPVICAHVQLSNAQAPSNSCMDMDTDKFYFIEVNPRVQVEHTVTEEVTGIDIVQAQIMIAEGKIARPRPPAWPSQYDIRLQRPRRADAV